MVGILVCILHVLIIVQSVLGSPKIQTFHEPRAHPWDVFSLSTTEKRTLGPAGHMLQWHLLRWTYLVNRQEALLNFICTLRWAVK